MITDQIHLLLSWIIHAYTLGVGASDIAIFLQNHHPELHLLANMPWPLNVLRGMWQCNPP